LWLTDVGGDRATPRIVWLCKNGGLLAVPLEDLLNSRQCHIDATDLHDIVESADNLKSAIDDASEIGREVSAVDERQGRFLVIVEVAPSNHRPVKNNSSCPRFVDVDQADMCSVESSAVVEHSAGRLSHPVRRVPLHVGIVQLHRKAFR
jgi:hypothetical protein